MRELNNGEQNKVIREKINDNFKELEDKCAELGEKIDQVPNGTTYSENEQIVGTWIDGRPVYEISCLITNDNIPDDEPLQYQLPINLGGENPYAAMFIDTKLTVYDGMTNFPFNYVQNSYSEKEHIEFISYYNVNDTGQLYVYNDGITKWKYWFTGRYVKHNGDL